ncbi:MAG: SDR family oxidoreductase [Planctomycetota bacterium]
MTQSLDAYHALVCGASAGIGRAAAISIARRGAAVTVLARSRRKLEELLPVLREAGAREARFLVADHDNRPALAETVRAFLKDNGPVHVLVNNSGGPPGGPILDAGDEDFLTAFGRHLLANHLLVKLVLPGMREAGWGRIVNIISMTVREPIVGLGVSNTVRGAVASWAKTLSLELPPGITINNVLPGYADTERLAALKESIAARTGVSEAEVERAWIASVPEERLGRPEELGAAVAFLASPEASFVRGVSLLVDGGRTRGI